MAASLKSGWQSLLAAGVFSGLSALTVAAANYAGDVFSLEVWSLTIPLDDDGDGFADDVVMPTLRNFEDPDFFHLSETSDSIVFKARSGAAKSERAAFPCCKLRELKKNSDVPASWNANDGLIHNLTITLAIHQTPGPGTAVVATGIYSENEPITTLRLEGAKLLLTRVGMQALVLESAYVPGTLFDLMLIVEDGRIRAFYKGASLAVWPFEQTNLHFRAGCEVQDSHDQGRGARGEGEVEIRTLYVTHKG
jgi:hypothetical protein